jgi:voltage-gated potassium channel
LANPALMRFLPAVPHQDEAWAAELVNRLVEKCGTGTPDLWRISLDGEHAAVLEERLAGQSLRLADLLRDPRDRDHGLDIVALALFRGEERMMAPSGDVVLHAGDDLLLAGHLRDRAALHTTLTEDPTASYVLDGRRVPASWVWRRLRSTEGADKARAGDGSVH